MKGCALIGGQGACLCSVGRASARLNADATTEKGNESFRANNGRGGVQEAHGDAIRAAAHVGSEI